MKRKGFLRRSLGIALALILSLGALWPSTVARASDITIDTSGFKDPTIDHMTLYIWRRGLPTASKAEDFGKIRDLLITWDGKYYIKCSDAFLNTVRTYYKMEGSNKKFNTSGLSKIKVKDKTAGRWITYYNGFYDYDDDDYYPYGYPHGWYRYNVSFNTSGLTEKLPMNFAAMREAGISATFDRIETLPWAAVSSVTDEYKYALGLKATDNTYYLLNAESKLWTWNEDYALSSDEQRTYFRSSLHDNKVQVQRQDGADKVVGLTQERTNLWRAYAGTGNTLRLESQGVVAAKHDGWAMNEDTKDLSRFESKVPKTVGLGHMAATLVSAGNARTMDYNTLKESGTSPIVAGSAGEFDIFWCEPIIMDFLQTDFSIVNGQVSNLDGPIAIANGTTITVKEGGTLTINNWVANNGTIVVEDGGTLYIQDNACLCRLNDGEHTGGGVICNGLVIVGDNAKLCGGGVDGLQFKAGSHVVNYGLVTSENFKIEKDHTIENRGGGVTFYGAGNGVTGSGMGTWNNAFSSSGYTEQGKVEPVCSTSIAPNGIYYD